MNLIEAREKYAHLGEKHGHNDVYGYSIIANILKKVSNEQEAHEKLLRLSTSHFPNDRLAIGYKQALDDLNAEEGGLHHEAAQY